MFSKAIQALFYVLAEAFQKLAAMPADWEPNQHQEMTGAEYLATLAPDDDPAAGSGPDVPPTINNPADIFGAPKYIMLPAAGGYSRADMLVNGWDDEALLANGMMERVVESPKPPAPPVAVGIPLVSSAPQPPAFTPAAPPAAPSFSGAPALLDADGVPHDARIHSGGATRTAADKWTKKKGVDAAYHAQITAELAQAHARPFVPLQGRPVPVVPPAAVVVPPPPPAAAPAVPAPPGNSAAAQVIAAANAARAADSGAPPVTFVELARWCTANGVGADKMRAVATSFGLEGFGSFHMNAAMIPAAFELLQAK